MRLFLGMDHGEMVDLLEQNGLQVIHSADSNGRSIKINGESGDYRINYWSENPEYIFGIHPEVDALASENGWFFEWQDSGTLMCHPD